MTLRPRASPYPLKVVFVDPDRRSVESLVQSVPFITATAVVPSATEALRAIAANSPHLLVTELTLADASGLELIRYVHQTPGLRHLLLMVITARSSVADKIVAFQTGADDYLVKPVDPEFFALRVRLLMNFSHLDFR